MLVCLMTALLLVLFHFAMQQGEVRRDRRERGSRTYVLSMMLLASSKHNNGEFPPWDPRPGHLFYDRDAVNPGYQLQHPLNRLPATQDTALLVGNINNNMGFILDSFPDNNQYFYLPYAVTSEEEGLALLDTYRSAIQTGELTRSPLAAPVGRGTCGSDQFLRIGNNMQNRLKQAGISIPDGVDIGTAVPVIFERPSSGRDPGGWVVPLNRQPVWVAYPGPFPMTERFIGALQDIEQELRESESAADEQH